MSQSKKMTQIISPTKFSSGVQLCNLEQRARKPSRDADVFMDGWMDKQGV